MPTSRTPKGTGKPCLGASNGPAAKGKARQSAAAKKAQERAERAGKASPRNKAKIKRAQEKVAARHRTKTKSTARKPSR